MVTVFLFLFLLTHKTKLTKQDFIKYWKDSSADDWKAVQQLFNGRNYVQALFFAHLVLEKLAKAHWVKDNTGNHPPRIHNLVAIIKHTKTVLPEEDLQFLAAMNDFQLEGRYPDYTNKLHKIYKSKTTNELLEKVNTLRKCLLKNL